MRKELAILAGMIGLFLEACAFPAAGTAKPMKDTAAYQHGGLRLGDRKELPGGAGELKELPGGAGELCRADAETQAAQDGDMAHSGIYVHVREQGENYWYQNESDFVAAVGFDVEEPFFVYFLPDGQKRLTLYYDDATQRGCGIRYYERDSSTFATAGMYGFVFEGLQESGEKEIREDYLRPEAFDGGNGAEAAEDFRENTEYDDQGRIIHYDASGILTDMSENNAKPDTILWIDYEYYDTGNLKSRTYWHNSYIFGTWYTTWNCYFDRQGRIAHEDIYITHGSWDTYYIYMDDTEEPAFILELDNYSGQWVPMFQKGCP